MIDQLSGTKRLVATLLCGSGLRLLEALVLRVKDLDLERREITGCEHCRLSPHRRA